MQRVRRSVLIGAAVAMVATAACGGGDDAEATGDILVFAAASLTDALGEIVAVFEDLNPGTAVQLNLAGSSALREQILEGAPADVFASADTSNMDQVVAAGEVAGEPTLFVANALQIAVPAGNPGGVTGPADFGDEDLLIGLCAQGVPCGDLGREALSAAGVVPAPDTEEPDVRALLTKLEAGELDAGIVYVTDVLAGGEGVEGIDIPDDYNVEAAYPIAVLAGAPNPEGAEAFVDFVRSDEGTSILTSHGFGSP